MTMASSSPFCPLHFPPTFIPIPARQTTHACFPCNSYIPYNHHSKREFPIAPVASVPYQPLNLDYLEGEFSGHGVTFEGVGESCIAKMELQNGSTATLMLPSGLITSYKSPMWHGEKMELLHTAVSEGEDGQAIIQGGVSLNFNFQTDDGEISWSPTNWVLRDVKGNPEESIQVELISRTLEDMVELKHSVTLRGDTLRSELEVTNSRSLPIQMAGSILSHLTVSTPDATYAVGLERSDYCSKPPFASEFFLSPPDFSQEGLGKVWNLLAQKQLFPHWGAKNQDYNQAESSQLESHGDANVEEMDNYKHLGERMSLIYTNAPRSYTVIDRGRRNSVLVGRNGFDEMYLFSPGSSVEIYSKYAYICVGQAAVLKPVLLKPECVWIGGQSIHNPNQ
ncbi:protein NDH-DEPENDENT CYCLIC ELECTRON FLOW 5 [Prosopis cineraria]|uniref:protein NDH-DEPENDENT CYCLIC ELECTRON FLOW 5 n=1 Tax=Prosopis cineraria TaxID=364024 RepID=UPI00240FB706|nr:protein NDH-DEPENDENT CYCLIC ELECTRON FLOW 5 [Prosopis cineraria]